MLTLVQVHRTPCGLMASTADCVLRAKTVLSSDPAQHGKADPAVTSVCSASCEQQRIFFVRGVLFEMGKNGPGMTMHHHLSPWEIPTRDEQGMKGKTQRCAERLYLQVKLVNMVI